MPDGDASALSDRAAPPAVSPDCNGAIIWFETIAFAFRTFVRPAVPGRADP